MPNPFRRLVRKIFRRDRDAGGAGETPLRQHDVQEAEAAQTRVDAAREQAGIEILPQSYNRPP